MSLSADTFFSALSNTVRLRCLALLQQDSELCVCELTYALSLSQPMISRHLAQLREAGIVQDRREGIWIYYRIHPGLPGWATEVLRITAAGIAAKAPYASDRSKLKSMPDRPEAPCCA